MFYPSEKSQYTQTRAPAGEIRVVDPSPLNWLYILFNTMEEVIRADHLGRIVPALATDTEWLNDKTLEVRLRKDVYFQNGQPFSAENIKRNFIEMNRWDAPHPPGTWLNLPKNTVCEIIDDQTVHFHFPKPDGLAVAKMRAFHIGNHLFWKNLGFGYAKIGSGEGHW
jgi:ABC-type transport system substrate-binding protein